MAIEKTEGRSIRDPRSAARNSEELALRAARRLVSDRVARPHLEAFLRYNSPRKAANLLHALHESRRGKAEARSKPFVLLLEPTNVCNLRCEFCLTGQGFLGGREARRLGFEEARRIVDQVFPYVYMAQLFNWGEPFLAGDLWPIVAYLHEKRVHTFLSTNLTIFGEKELAGIFDSGLDYLKVCIDGAAAGTYGRFRKGGDFGEVLENLRRLVREKRRRGSKRPYIEWQYVVFRHNEGEMDEARRMARRIGVDEILFAPGYVEDEEWLPENPKYRLGVFYPGSVRGCSRLWTHLNVKADGGVAPCCYEYYKEDDFGNILETPFEELWNNRAFSDSRRFVRDMAKGLPTAADPGTICGPCMRLGRRPTTSLGSVREGRGRRKEGEGEKPTA